MLLLIGELGVFGIVLEKLEGRFRLRQAFEASLPYDGISRFSA